MPPASDFRLSRALECVTRCAVELPINCKVPIGRKTNQQHWDVLHISREQVVFELMPDAWGRLLISMTNVSAPSPFGGARWRTVLQRSERPLNVTTDGR